MTKDENNNNFSESDYGACEIFELYCSITKHPFRKSRVKMTPIVVKGWADVASALIDLSQQQNYRGRINYIQLSDVGALSVPFFVVSQKDLLIVYSIGSDGGWNAYAKDASELFIRPEDQMNYQAFSLKLKPVLPFDSNSVFDMLYQQLGNNKRVIFEAVFATFMIGILSLAAAMYTMQVYDRVVSANGLSTLLVLTVGVIIAIIFEFFLKQSRAFLVDHTAKNIDLNIGSELFDRALDIRLDSRPKTIGTFAGQLRQFDYVKSFLTSSTLFVLADIPFAFFFIFIIFIIAGPVAFVPLAMVPLAVLVGLSFQKPIEKLVEKHLHESNIKNGLLIESIDGIETLKSVGSEWVASKKYQDLSSRISESDVELRLLSAKATNITQVIQQFNFVGIIALGAYLINVGELTIGGLIACSIIAGRALAPLAQIPSLLSQWKQVKISLNALTAILSLPCDGGDLQGKLLPAQCEGKIVLEDVEFSYDEGSPILAIPFLDLSPGEKIAFIGPIGSGKSTLMKIIAGLFEPTKGQVKIDGIGASNISTGYIHENITYLPQDIRLFNGSLRENLVLGSGYVLDEKILDAARKTGLDAVINSHPKGLDLLISEGGLGLSVGQRQLVGLTRLLLMSPKVILLDEPTASMDGHTEAKVIDVIFNLFPSEVSIFVVTHKTAILPKVDRIVVLDKGGIMLDGSAQDILDKLSSRKVNK